MFSSMALQLHIIPKKIKEINTKKVKQNNYATICCVKQKIEVEEEDLDLLVLGTG